jgi:hypothetical protein
MDWSACFAPGFPGVVQAVFTLARRPELRPVDDPEWVDEIEPVSRSEYVQWFVRPAIDADGAYEIATSATYLMAPTVRIGDIRRGDLIAIGGTTYKASTNPKDDGFGVSTIYCEPA